MKTGHVVLLHRLAFKCLNSVTSEISITSYTYPSFGCCVNEFFKVLTLVFTVWASLTYSVLMRPRQGRNRPMFVLFRTTSAPPLYCCKLAVKLQPPSTHLNEGKVIWTFKSWWIIEHCGGRRQGNYAALTQFFSDRLMYLLTRNQQIGRLLYSSYVRILDALTHSRFENKNVK